MALPPVTTADIAYLESQPRSESRDNLLHLAYHALRRQPKPRKTPETPKVRAKRGAKSLKTLIRDLDVVFKRWVRLRDTKDGWGACISCGVLKPFDDLDGGHFAPCKHMPTRWDPENVHAQCRHCNRFVREGAIPGFARGLRAKGIDPDVLEIRARINRPLDKFDLAKKIEYYTQLTAQMEA